MTEFAMDENHLPQLLTEREVADRLRVKPSTIRAARLRGAHLKRARIETPLAAEDVSAELTGRARRRGIGEEKRREVIGLLLAGVTHRQIVERAQVSSGTISAIRRELKALGPLYRADSSDSCVPFACRGPENARAPGRQRVEKAGGPGRT